MKYNKLFVVGLVFSAFGYAMEKPLVPHTQIKVIKGSLYEADGKVDLLVVGLHEQKRLDVSFKILDEKCQPIEVIGATKLLTKQNQYVNIMKKEDDSDSVEETRHHPGRIIKHRNQNFYEKKMNSRCLVVVEPKLYNFDYNNQKQDYFYREGQNDFYAEEAIRQAGIDLFNCYQNVLKEGLKCLGDKQDKSIAIPTLSTSTFFPRRDAARVALTSVFKFIQDNPGAYSYIQLFVKKRFELEMYRSFFSIEPGKNNESTESSESEEEKEKYPILVYGWPTGMHYDALV